MLVRFVLFIARAIAIAAIAASCNTKPAVKPPANEYVDAKLCAGCHAEIYRNYSRTGMAKAFYISNEASFSEAQPYFHGASCTWY